MFFHNIKVWIKRLSVIGVLLCGMADASEDVPRRIASWPHILGSHRAVFSLENPAKIARITIPWRRPDAEPEKRGLILIDLATGQRLRNFAIMNFGRETVDLVFEPQSIPGKYALYYLPLKQVDPKRQRLGATKWEYAPREDAADPVFLERAGFGENRYLEAGVFESLPAAKLEAIEARSQFDSFDPMEVIATEEEVATLKQLFPVPFLLFPEDRKFPIRMSDYLPLRWIRKKTQSSFRGEAQRGEFYAFQVGVFAASQAVSDLEVSWGDFRCGDQLLSANALELINRDVSDIYGKRSTRKISVAQNKVQPLWFVLTIPAQAGPGTYQGELRFRDGKYEQTLPVAITVADTAPIKENGTGDAERMARLKWLNSDAGLKESIPKPYEPLKIEGETIIATGKRIIFGKNGMPKQIQVGKHELLAEPVSLQIRNSDVLTPTQWKCAVTEPGDRIVHLRAEGHNRVLQMVVNTRVEFDGYMFFNIAITAFQDLKISEIELLLPYRAEIAKYMMGLDIGRGGVRPATVDWKWSDCPNNKAWIGNVDAGLRCKLRGDKALEHVWEEYRPEINGIPESWNNNGKGGARVREFKNKVELQAFTGNRELQRGETLELNFSLLPTPVKERDSEHWMPPAAWKTRYSFLGCSAANNAALGSSGAVLFHATPANPCINYPLYLWEEVRNWSRSVRATGQRAMLYYKVGELSNHAAEFFALKSLGDEIFFDEGDGQGDEWLNQHLGTKFRAKWCSTPWGLEKPSDASLQINGGSRWENFYMASLPFLIRNADIEGLYLDGLGYSRQFLQRVRSVSQEERGDNFALDFHSGNTITRRSNSYNDVMEHLPYLDSTWIGEGFDYNLSPEFYLVELSGIPFGVPNSMLQYGGNAWRGMIYGMTTRPLGNHASNPFSLWEFFDRIKMPDSRMIGYWEKNCPVRSSNPEILCTVYAFPDKALIAVAGWGKQDQKCTFKIDWKALNLSPAETIAYTPEIPGFQTEQTIDLTKELTVPQGRGYLILVEKKKTLGKIETPVSEDATAEPQNFAAGKDVLPETGGAEIRRKQKTLVVSGKENTSAFVELAIPADVTAVECRMRFPDAVQKPGWHDRFDGMQSPGISIQWQNGRYFRLYEGSLGVWVIDDMLFDHMYVPDPKWKNAGNNCWLWVRIGWNDRTLTAESSLDGKSWEMIYRLPRSVFAGQPQSLRLGKMSKSCGWPKTLKLSPDGKEQTAEYSDLVFYRKKSQ